MKPAIGLLLSLMSTMHVEAYASTLLIGKKNDPVQLPVLYYRIYITKFNYIEKTKNHMCSLNT